MNYLTVTLDYMMWWYSGGLKRLFAYISALFGWVSNFFSVKKVLLTLFSPWRRLVGVKRPGLEGLRDWMIDNFISRLVGFFARLIIILVYLLSMVGLLLFTGLATVFWLAIPILIIYSFIRIFF